MKRQAIKRETDLQIVSDWVEQGARVLDLGCGRGILLEYLHQTRGIYGVGVDNDPQKILGCVKRGVNAYQGDIKQILSEFPDQYFDWVVCSRTLQELNKPKEVLFEAMRVGKRLAVGFVNFGFWLNRWHLFSRGQRVRNEVYPEVWHESRSMNPVSIADFESFCRDEGVSIHRRMYLGSDWKTPCRFLPGLFAGYALFEVSFKRPPSS